MKERFYCSLCWDEFDDPQKHNQGSYFKGERLDGKCVGNILVADGISPRPGKFNGKDMPVLNLDAGEPIKFR